MNKTNVKLNSEDIIDEICDWFYDEYGVEQEDGGRRLVIDAQVYCSDFEKAINEAITKARKGYK